MQIPFKVVGITGFKETGKTTFARAIKAQYPSTAIYSFAKPLKEVCHILFGGTEANWYGDFKTQLLTEWEHRTPVQPTPRKLMQYVGTELFRDNFNSNFWLHVAERYIGDMYLAENFTLCVVDDVRFDNEAEFLRMKYDAAIVRLVRTDKQIAVVDGHVSERGVSHELVDFTYTFSDITQHAAFAGSLLDRINV